MAGLVVDDGNVLGRCVTVSGPRGLPRPCLQIVGVVESQRKDFLDPAPIPMMFRPVAQAPDALPNSSPMLLVRTAGASTAHATAVHAALQGLRGDLPFVSVAPLAEELRNSLRPFRLGAMLFTLFGALALILSAVGLHAVLGYFVAERTGEVGIRRALGAPAIAVMRLVVRQSLVPVAAGLVIGLGASLLVARAVASRLFGIEPHDPVSIAAAAACLMAIAGLATLVPVWRAIRIDPMIALRRD
jgi:ABC-type antimicrobial peptide transport system permease subunit